MPRGSKAKYTDKQDRQAEHIAEGYKERGVSTKEAKSRAWATVNKMTGGGKKSGSGRGKKVDKSPAKKGGRKGGASSSRTASSRSAAGKRAARTRKRK
jgi:plasmid stabilization system protein ParE